MHILKGILLYRRWSCDFKKMHIAKCFAQKCDSQKEVLIFFPNSLSNTQKAKYVHRNSETNYWLDQSSQFELGLKVQMLIPLKTIWAAISKTCQHFTLSSYKIFSFFSCPILNLQCFSAFKIKSF